MVDNYDGGIWQPTCGICSKYVWHAGQSSEAGGLLDLSPTPTGKQAHSDSLTESLSLAQLWNVYLFRWQCGQVCLWISLKHEADHVILGI